MSSKAAATRLNILQKAFELVYRNGYRTTSVDDIIATTRVTKGAFFYHFKNKDEMGLAMINEVMHRQMHEALISPLAGGDDPLAEIYEMMQSLLVKNPFFITKYGCPAINLTEEMASQSETYRKALEALNNEWRDAIATSLERGKATGKVNQDIDSREAAFFVMSGYGGIRNLGKIYGKEVYHGHLNQLKIYLDSLR